VAFFLVAFFLVAFFLAAFFFAAMGVTPLLSVTRKYDPIQQPIKELDPQRQEQTTFAE
jgi:hypothetical protein